MDILVIPGIPFSSRSGVGKFPFVSSEAKII